LFLGCVCFQWVNQIRGCVCCLWFCCFGWLRDFCWIVGRFCCWVIVVLFVVWDFVVGLCFSSVCCVCNMWIDSISILHVFVYVLFLKFYSCMFLLLVWCGLGWFVWFEEWEERFVAFFMSLMVQIWQCC